MGWFSHDDDNERVAYEQVVNVSEEHKSSIGHELIAGAASFAAMKAYQDHQEANGKPQSFDTAKNIIAGLAGMEVDKLVETKGLDAIDRERAKHEAAENAKQALANSQQFGQQDYQRQQYGGGGGGGYGGQQGGYGGQQGGYGGQGGGYGGGGHGGGYGGQGGGYGGGREERRDERREERHHHEGRGEYGGGGGYGGQGGGPGGYGGGPGGYGGGPGGYGGGQGGYDGERREGRHHGGEGRW